MLSSFRVLFEEKKCRTMRTVEYGLCVYKDELASCQKLAERSGQDGLTIKCHTGDRVECMTMLSQKKIDFMKADIEDMYAASKLFDNKTFMVFKEIRTFEEPDEEFRYRAVVVVHKELEVSSYADLKGLRSCHTGFRRNAGYKIPLTVLTNMGVIENIDDLNLTSTENELKRWSKFFSKSCIVGNWSPDPEVDRRLKSTYSNLCEVCQDPSKCAASDPYSGYEGAIKCLVEGRGQVAFTKMIAARKMFGLPYGKQPAISDGYSHEDYAYLCPDGSKMPIDSDHPCFTASRPWAGYMTHHDDTGIPKLRAAISKLYETAKTNNDWLRILGLDEKTFPSDNVLKRPGEYLEKANYNDVIERRPDRTLKIALTDEEENKNVVRNCHEFSAMVYSRGIRPRFVCSNVADTYDGLTYAVREGRADIAFVDPGVALAAVWNNDLVPALREEYGRENDLYVFVPTIDKGITNLGDLKGKKVFLFYDYAVRNTILKLLLDGGHLSKNACPYGEKLFQYFDMILIGTDDLNGSEEDAKATIIIPYANLPEQNFLKNHELLCPSGKRQSLDNLEGCSWGTLPPRMVMMRKNESAVKKEEITTSLAAVSSFATAHKEIMDILNNKDRYNGYHLISTRATGLKVSTDTADLEKYGKVVKELSVCRG